MKGRRIGLAIAPVAIIVLSALGAVALVRNRPEIDRQVPVPPPPLVRVYGAEPRDVPVFVDSQGTVQPRTETTLVSEVAGRIVDVSAVFAGGGFFSRGDVLVRIDPTDYELAVVQARSEVAQSELLLAREEAEAAVARKEWGELGGGDPSPLASRELQVAQARAAFEAARARLRQAERNLDRTRVRAPYDGRIRRTQVDVGQYVAPGTPIASVFATDYVEIRLPVRDVELGFLDLPLTGPTGDRGAPVSFVGSFAGGTHEWWGEVVRVESEIDPRTRMVHLVARVEDPYTAGTTPLSVGLFVEARISGPPLAEVLVIPRTALRPEGEVLVVDSSDRLRARRPEVVRTDRDRAYLRGGLDDGERVCLSNLAVWSDGMAVRTQEVDPFSETDAERAGSAPVAAGEGRGVRP